MDDRPSVEARAMRQLLDQWELPDSAAPVVERTVAFRQRCLGFALRDLGDALYAAAVEPARRLAGKIEGLIWRG